MKLETRKRIMDRKVVEYLLEKKGIRDIGRQLKVGDRRVRKFRALAISYGYLNESGSGPGTIPMPAYPEPLFAYGPDGRGNRGSEVDTVLSGRKEWIVERLTAKWHPITIFEELKLPIARSSFYRFLHRHDLYRLQENARRRVVPEIIHTPGDALLLDWGKLRDVVDEKTGKKRTLWALVGVLGYSRLIKVKLVWSNSVAETIPAIEDMLRELGGVPRRITSDNPKCFATEASKYEPLLHPVFERMASHYGFLIECLPPADPEKKGKVERQIPYIRRLYEAHGSDWHGIEESQKYLEQKLVIANERKHGTTGMRPAQQFLDIEKNALKPLPTLAYSLEEVSEGRVRRDGHVRFSGKYYSCDETQIGSDVLILATDKQVSLYSKGKLIEVHERVPSDRPWQSKSTKDHHLKPWEREMRDDSTYRKRARGLGPDVERLVGYLIEQGQGFIDTRKIWGILSLDKTYDAVRINEACRKALELGILSYRTVKQLLNILPTDSTQSGERGRQIQNTHKFARPLSVYERRFDFKPH